MGVGIRERIVKTNISVSSLGTTNLNNIGYGKLIDSLYRVYLKYGYVYLQFKWNDIDATVLISGIWSMSKNSQGIWNGRMCGTFYDYAHQYLFVGIDTTIFHIGKITASNT